MGHTEGRLDLRIVFLFGVPHDVGRKVLLVERVPVNGALNR
jgi:hypothetical protein